MQQVTIIDYGLCNMDSIARAIKKCGAEVIISKTPEDIQAATHLILPGVGAFRDAMHNLQEASLDALLRQRVLQDHIPFLGICLGMQLMGSKGHEGGETPGLGLIEGETTLMEAKNNERIPHVGWNQVKQSSDHPLFAGIPSDSDFYFVHSYQLRPAKKEHVLATTPYAGSFSSVVGHGTIVGTQFHPEKSQKLGFRLLQNFLSFR